MNQLKKTDGEPNGPPEEATQALATMKTDVQFKNGILSYTLCFLAFITLPFIMAIVAIPVILLLTKNLIHACSCCGNQVGSDGKIIYSLKFMDDVVTIRMGEMGFILSRKLILNFLVIAVTVSVLMWKVKHAVFEPHVHSHENDPIYPSNATWQQYYDECNIYRLIEHKDPLVRHCLVTYMDKTVSSWSGYIMRVEDLRGTLKQYTHHALTILLQMEPTEQTEQMKYADVQITFDTERAEHFADIIDGLSRGQRIGFNATIKSIGIDGSTRHFHAKAIWHEEGFREIEPHVHHQGRYKEVSKNIRKPKGLDHLSLPDKPQSETNQQQQQQQQEPAQ